MGSTWLQDFEGLNRVETPDGGWLAELWKRLGLGQLTLRSIPPGKGVGNHCHPNTDEWWIVIAGWALVLLRSPDDSETRGFELDGDALRVLEVPRGTWHSVLNYGKGDVLLLFFANRVYNPEQPDKEVA